MSKTRSMQERAGGDQGDEAPEGGGDGDEGVAQGVVAHGLVERPAFGDRGADVVGGQVVHELVLHHHGEEGERADGVTEERQGGVAEDVPDFPEGDMSAKS
jgi:hypothetical protein